MRSMTWTLCAIAIVCVSATATAQSALLGNATVSVAVNESWTDTGLDVVAGNRLIITATGTAAGSSIVQGTQQWFGPEGVGENCEDPNRPFPWAFDMLVGRIGESGPAFPVGSFRAISVDAPGRLYLGINDGFPGDNSGYFVAVIYVISCGTSAVGSLDPNEARRLRSYPNPVGRTATVAFGLASPGVVDLRLYDSSGRQVRTVAEGSFGSGSHVLSWDGRDSAGNEVAPGVYFYELLVDGHREGGQKTIVLR